MKKLHALVICAVALLPGLVYAQLLTETGQLIDRVGFLTNRLTVVIAGIALLVFFWGLVKFILAAGDPESKAEGKQIMIWGIIALFVMVSIWGIVYFIGNELFPGASYEAPPIRTFPTF